MRTEGTQIWSCGGGTQSGAIAALIGDERLPRPDLCLMVNTGRERSGTWPFVDGFIRPQLARVGLELTVIPATQPDGSPVSLYASDGSVLLPGFTTITGTVGKLSPFCSGTWKRDVQERYLRSIGVVTGTQWLGISCDELKRLRTQHRPWLRGPNGEVIHINRRGIRSPKRTCKFCKAVYTGGKLCDFPVGNGRTCDAEMCDRCARTLGRGEVPIGGGLKRINDTIDVCPIHRGHAVVVDGQILEFDE